jgi:hypothetical protein
MKKSYPRTLEGAAISPELTSLVGELAHRLLNGSTPVHDQLRGQLAVAHIRDIELTGVGLYANFGGLSACQPVEPKRLIGGDVFLNVEGLEHGAGSLLCVTDGRLACVEIYTFGDEAWPDEPKVVSLDNGTPIEV